MEYDYDDAHGPHDGHGHDPLRPDTGFGLPTKEEAYSRTERRRFDNNSDIVHQQLIYPDFSLYEDDNTDYQSNRNTHTDTENNNNNAKTDSRNFASSFTFPEQQADSRADSQTEGEGNFSPKTHPFARRPHSFRQSSRGSKMNTGMGNMDPTNEYMYQIPPGTSAPMGMGMEMGTGERTMDGMKAFSEGGLGQRGSQNQALDLKALNERLQTLGLGLGGPSIDSFGTTVPAPRHQQPHQQHHQQQSNPEQNQFSAFQTPTTVPSNHLGLEQLGSGFQSPPSQSTSPRQVYNNPGYNQTIHAYPSITELAPNDSISMYRPVRAPSTAARSTRRGGTNVDPGEAGEIGLSPEEEPQIEGAASYWAGDDATQHTPATEVDRLEDEMTVGPTSVWTRGDMGRDMYDHRDRLLRQESDQNQRHMSELNQQIRAAQSLATTATKLEAAEKQLRELQARLIAEQVARTQIEQEAGLREDEMKNYQTEWASAVRALRRAREEGKKTEEEKRRILRCFEEARDKLWKYHEALRVREARAQGRDEGRAEAWQEAERWMGESPPIPGFEPVQAVPGAVLRQSQTPMMQAQTPGYAQSPTAQYFYQNQPQPQQQQGQSQAQSPGQAAPQPQGAQQSQAQGQFIPQMASPGPNNPMQSIAQLMEYFAQNPGAFPQSGQPPQHVTPPQAQPEQQQQPQSQMPLQAPRAAEMPHTTPGMQRVSMPQAQPQPHQTPGRSMQPMMPQNTGVFTQPQSMAPALLPQQTGQQMVPQHTGAQAVAQPIMVPIMVPMSTAPQYQPQSIPISTSQLPPGPTPQTRPTVPPQTRPTIPTQPPTLSQRTPRAPAAQMHQTPGGKTQASTSTRTQATQLPPANAGPRTGVSTVPRVPAPETVSHPHAAESYLERVDHDPSVKRMMAGARLKTIHSSAVPPTEATRAPTVPHTAARSTFDDGASNVDKPLPNPFPPSAVLGQTGGNGHVARSQTQRASSARTNQTQGDSQRKMGRRMSLAEGLHNSHANRISQIPDGDRYPAFPMGGNGHAHHNGKTHSRQTSYGSVDSPAIGLPASRDVSTFQSPNSEHRATRPSARATPVRSGRTSARSRVAGALRNDMDLESELPGIQEAEEEDIHGHGPPPTMPSHGQGQSQGQMPPPHMLRQMQAAQAQQQRGPPRAPPSMPNMRNRITPVMPQPLGGGPPTSGANKPFSGPRGGGGGQAQGQSQRHRTQHSISALFNHRDAAGARTEQLPEPESVYHPPKTHDIFVPPQLAPMAVSGGVEDVSGPRHSALGLSGIGSEDGHGNGAGMGMGNRMRAPTSSRSRSNHPPSAYFAPSPEPPAPAPALPHEEGRDQGQSQSQTQRVPEPTTSTSGRQPINLDSPPRPGTTRQTVIITERTDPRPLPSVLGSVAAVESDHHRRGHRHTHADAEPAQVPLPPHRSVAPTAYTGVGTARGAGARGGGGGGHGTEMEMGVYRFPPENTRGGGGGDADVDGIGPEQVPLPPPKSMAPTMYSVDPHGVPLPPSKSMAPTAYTAAQSSVGVDKKQAQSHHRSQSQPQPQPHQVPLPGSRSIAPTAYTASPPNHDPSHSQSQAAPRTPARTHAQNQSGTQYEPQYQNQYQYPIHQRTPSAPPEVRSIDFAVNVPLPRAEGTVYDQRTVVDSTRGGGVGGSKKSYRKPVPVSASARGKDTGNIADKGNGNWNGKTGQSSVGIGGQSAVEPRMYPLPPSKAPTARGRASTYAASVPPIEEVTEPESGRENTIRRTQASLRAA